MPLAVPIGIDDFRKLRELGLAYVDKSSLIREILDAPGVQAILLPRPRRFGKTLNLSMLRCFFEKRDEDLSPLFEDLAIWQAGDAYRAHFQRYPVIYLTFKGTRAAGFDACMGALKKKIEVLFDEHRAVLATGRLSEQQARDYQAILDGTASPTLYRRALLDLSLALHTCHGENVVILLDEYDEPIHAGHAGGFADAILDFMRALFIDGLKGNPHLARAVVTGILRVARESLFSGANNLGVYTLLARRYRTSFGFTEAEVVSLMERAGRLDGLDAVRAWYNGYLFGGETIYNPWSVLNFLEREEARPRAYWVGTSSNDLVRELLERYALPLEPLFETLLEGGSIERSVDENVVLDELHESESALWSLLLFSGYLKAEEIPGDPVEPAVYRLSIPNREVRGVFATTFQRWMERRLDGRGGSVDKLTRALLDGDAERLEEQLQTFVGSILSYQDPGAVDPESVYQGFVLGLLATLEPDYRVRSNRESGAGRPDVMIVPRDPSGTGVVLELKVARKGRRTPAAALAEGIAQIREKGYEAELCAMGVGTVRAFAVAFDGKRVRVKAAAPPQKKAGRTKAKR